MAKDRNSAKPHPTRVFISHADVDMAAARKIRNLLVYRANADVFTAEDLSADENWENQLRDKLSAADIVVALLSPTSVHSSWVLHEIGAAWALGKIILPVVTGRDVLNNMLVLLANAHPIEMADVETAENADRFLGAFESSLGQLTS
jgi:hypothetical protein